MSPLAEVRMPETIDVVTRFGTFEADAGDVVRVVDGLPGFESCRRYVIVSSPELAPFTCLQGLDDPRPSFLVIDPRLVVAEYGVELSTAERRRLEAAAGDALLWLALVRIGDGADASVNLRAPIVVNPRRMAGLQVIAADSPYALQHPLGPD